MQWWFLYRLLNRVFGSKGQNVPSQTICVTNVSMRIWRDNSLLILSIGFDFLLIQKLNFVALLFTQFIPQQNPHCIYEQFDEVAPTPKSVQQSAISIVAFNSVAITIRVVISNVDAHAMPGNPSKMMVKNHSCDKMRQIYIRSIFFNKMNIRAPNSRICDFFLLLFLCR